MEVETDAQQRTTAGEDLAGHTALSLLTTAPRAGRVMYVLAQRWGLVWSWSEELPTLTRVELSRDGSWPLADRSLEAVVADANAIDDDVGARVAFLREARRVAGTAGGCVIAARATRRPHAWHAWRTMLRAAPAGVWRGAASAGSAWDVCTVPLAYDGTRLTGLECVTAPAGGAAGRVAVVLRPAGAPATLPTIDAVLESAGLSAGSGLTFRPERLMVRKIGKTAVFGTLTDGVPCVVRIPRSPAALIRARRNAGGLGAIQGSALPESCRRVVPRLLGEGRARGYDFFVESLAAGVDGARPAGASSRERQRAAIEFITTVHEASAQRVRMGDPELARLVGGPFDVLRAWAGREDRAPLAALQEVVTRRLAGALLPLVWAHGDFAPANCLYEGSRLSGVIDWELFTDSGLPLLDVVQRVEIAGESSAHARWQRFDWMLDMVAEGSWPRIEPLAAYAARLRLEATAVPALLLMHWVDHVASRVWARGHDAAWVCKRYRQPLDRLAAWMGGGSPGA